MGETSKKVQVQVLSLPVFVAAEQFGTETGALVVGMLCMVIALFSLSRLSGLFRGIYLMFVGS